MTSLPQLELSAARQFRLSSWLRDQLENMPQQGIEMASAPAELTVLGIFPDLVYCKEAWPHTDPDWQSSVFFTMTVEQTMFQFCRLSKPDGELALAGKVFCVEPLGLHWLRPDPVGSTCWLGLQWVVARRQCSAFKRELAAAILRWNALDFVLPQLGVVAKTEPCH